MKRWFRIGYHGFIVGKLEELKECARTLENCLNQELSKLDKHIKEAARLEGEEEKDWLYESYSDNHWNLSEVFPRILRASLFVACYSFLEDGLNKICELSQEKNKCLIHYSDLKGKGIDRAQRYLKKVIGIEFPDQSTVWAEILRYRDIRNIITHNDSKLDKDEENGRSKRVKDYIEKKASIQLDSYENIQLTLDFIIEVIDIMKLFFDLIFESFEKKYHYHL